MGFKKKVTKPTLPPARSAALEALHRCFEGGRDVQAALDASLSGRGLDPRDVGLATELCYGYLRFKGRIDYVLSRFVKDVSVMPTKLRLALGVAAYEILQLDRVPVYASVDWAVEFSKTYPKARLAGLFNAVLRRVSELGPLYEDEDWYRVDAPSDEEFLSRFYSCPEWIVTLWLRSYGRDTAVQYLKAQISAPLLGLNLYGHPLASDLFNKLAGREDLVDLDGMGFALEAGARFRDPEVGPVHRQSFASRQIMDMLRPETWDTPVWDACSGRGGKTRLLLEKGLSPIIASDVHMGRLKALSRELPEVSVFQARADEEAPVSEMGTVLLDLPCSGFGVLSRRPDIKWKRLSSDVADLVRIQKNMLENVLKVVKPGGRIVIVTCTLDHEENEGLVEWFLGQHSNVSEELRWSTPADSPLNEFFFGSVLKVGQ